MVCRKSAPPKTAKPAKLRTQIGQFNETVYMDLGYVTDSSDKKHGYLVLVDDGTDWCVCKHVPEGKTAQELFDLVETGWLDWAGPPDVMIGDSERGFALELFVDKLGKSGVLLTPAAGYAPWQKGQVERKIESLKSIIAKVVFHRGLQGNEDMRLAGIEAASALNQRPGVTGVSPGMMLFRQKTKLYGEIMTGDGPMYHPEVDSSNVLGCRLDIRNSSKQSAEVHFAKETLRTAVSARTRLVENTSVGELVFFYRRYPSQKSRQLQAQRGCYLGPGVVIGHQGQNAWVSYAGRCSLVAPEHLRGLAPDEVASTKPLVRHGLEQLKQAAKATDYIDLSRQDIPDIELRDALARPSGDDHEVDDVLTVAVPPNDSTPSTDAPPVQELPPEPVDVETEGVEQVVEEHVQPETTDQEVTSESVKRKADGTETATETETEAPPLPVTWKPTGENDKLKWKRQKSSGSNRTIMAVIYGKKVMTPKLRKKMLDKEILCATRGTQPAILRTR